MVNLVLNLLIAGSLQLCYWVHQFKLGSVVIYLILEPTHVPKGVLVEPQFLIFLSQDSWLTPNEFQFISGRETAKVSF